MLYRDRSRGAFCCRICDGSCWKRVQRDERWQVHVYRPEGLSTAFVSLTTALTAVPCWLSKQLLATLQTELFSDCFTYFTRNFIHFCFLRFLPGGHAFQALLPAPVCKKRLALCSGHLLLSLFTVASSAGCAWLSKDMSPGQSAKCEFPMGCGG